MTNQEAIKILSSLLSVRNMFLIYPDEKFYDAIECAVAALAGGPIKIEVTEIHKFAKPDDTEGLDFPNSEVWNGSKGQTIQPKGTFEKIFNDPDEDQEDKF